MGKIESINCKVIFGEAVRRIWLIRNAFIFRNAPCATENLYWSIIVAAREFETSMDILSYSDRVCRELHIGWKAPVENWLKCNVE